MLISIIVPVYNASKTIAQCLQSLISQSIDDIEVIVVNDGSIDSSKSIINDYASRYPEMIRVVHQDNSGPAIARNRGLDLATGEFIGFVDADDVVAFDMFQKMLEPFHMNPDIDLTICGRYDILSDKTQILKLPDPAWQDSNIYKNPNMIHRMTPFLWDKLYRRSLINLHNIRFPKNIHFAEDAVFVNKYKLYCRAIHVILEPLYYYTEDRSDSITGTCSDKWMDITKAMRSIRFFYLKKGLFYKFSERLEILTIGFYKRRFKNLHRFSNKRAQIRYVFDAINYLDSAYPSWKKREKKRTKSSHLYTSKYLAFFYIILPNFLKRYTLSSKILSQYHKFNPATIIRKFGYRRVRYAIYRKHHPIKENSVLLVSYSGSNMNGNLFYIAEELLKRGGYNIFFSVRDINKFRPFIELHGLNIKIVKYNSYNYYKHLATAKYIFTNSRVASFFVKRKNQILVNTWHGTPLKTLGFSMNSGLSDIGNNQTQFLMCDYLLYPNSYTKEKIERDFFLDKLYTGNIIVSGYPRNDIFFNIKKSQNIKRLLGYSGKIIFCYMPTWRGETLEEINSKNYISELQDLFHYLDSALNEQKILLVKLHQSIKGSIDFSDYSYINAFPEEYETYEILNTADSLITDYSSVLFDFATSGRNIALFAYDIEEYVESRGLYFDISDLPFPILKCNQDLFHYLKEYKNNRRENYLNDEKFIQRFCQPNAANNSEILVDIIFSQVDPKELMSQQHSNTSWNVHIFDHVTDEVDLDLIYKCIKESANPLLIFRQAKFNSDMNNLLRYLRNKSIACIVYNGEWPITPLEKGILILNEKLNLLNKKTINIYKREFFRIAPYLSIDTLSDHTKRNFFNKLVS